MHLAYLLASHIPDSLLACSLQHAACIRPACQLQNMCMSFRIIPAASLFASVQLPLSLLPVLQHLLAKLQTTAPASCLATELLGPDAAPSGSLSSSSRQTAPAPRPTALETAACGLHSFSACPVQSVASSILAPSLKHITEVLALTWRARLTRVAHKAYLSRRTFYLTSQFAGLQVC